MNIHPIIVDHILAALQQNYGLEISSEQVIIQETHPDFAGEYSVVCFPFTTSEIGTTENVAISIGQYLQEKMEEIVSFDTNGGYLNLRLSHSCWRDQLLIMAEKGPKQSRLPSSPQIKDAFLKAKAIANRSTAFPGNPKKVTHLHPTEINLIKHIIHRPTPDPEAIARAFLQFYNQVTVTNAPHPHVIAFRIELCRITASLLESVDTIVE